MSSAPKRPWKQRAFHQEAQSPGNDGSSFPEFHPEVSHSPVDPSNSQEASDLAGNSSTVTPDLHRPPARPLAQSESQPDSEPAASEPFMATPDAEDTGIDRQQPIPPPSEPMQYRAIGLVNGRYIPSEQQFNRGVLLTTDGSLLDAVLLGRVMSLVKKHLTLEQEHLWVVYPRTRENNSSLHIQILGVWEPAELGPEQLSGIADSGDAASENVSVSDGYFSIRGEVVYQAQDKGYIVVKINQAPRRKDSESSKAFKLRLEGVLPAKALGYFWNLDARRQENALVIEQGHSIAAIPPRKVKGQRKPYPRASQRERAQKPTRPASTEPLSPDQPVRQGPIQKPIKRKTQGGAND